MHRLLPGYWGFRPIVFAAFLIAWLAAITACSGGQTASTPPTTVPKTPTSTVPVVGPLANGQDIFLTATDASGVAVVAQGFAMMTRAFACADCHGPQGKGGTVYMMMARYDVPNITWPVLTGPDYTPPFTVDILKRAITQGLDEKGQPLDPFMPRWTMSPQDLSDLASYIQTLK